MIHFIWHKALRQTRSQSVSGSVSFKFAGRFLTGCMPMALMRSKLQCLHSATESPCKRRTHSWKPQGGGVEKWLRLDSRCSLSISSLIFSKLSKFVQDISDTLPGSLCHFTAICLSEWCSPSNPWQQRCRSGSYLGKRISYGHSKHSRIGLERIWP